MIFPANFEEKLGFDQVRRMLEEHCLSALGRDWVEKIRFSDNAAEISRWLTLTAEMKQIVQFEERFPAQDYYDMVPELLRIRIPGTYLETDTLSELRLSLMTITGLVAFITSRSEKFPALNSMVTLSDQETGNQPLILSQSRLSDVAHGIERIVDERSEVRDSASAELSRIRSEKAKLLSTVERRVLQSFKTARQSGWTPADAEVTIRNGRLVIPMINTHKRKVPGFIHDESATGQTVYVEPAEIFETNNEIRELEYAERREIVRILTTFTDSLRPDLEVMIRSYHFLGTIDFIRAKAVFAVSVGGTNPIRHPDEQPLKSDESLSFSWVNAMHPLLYLSHSRQNKKVVPLNLSLGSDRRILIISGPNAGGKSVCLKTAGLVQYMFQCGLLPPVREDSEFCIFRNIFIDIGDEQSIDNDLSTYTSKLHNLKFFIENTDHRSLFLIDELGTGTDPSLGGAIAEATLEALNARKAMGVVTTHYSNLKLLAGREQGIVNGAMLFDIKKLRPLYTLKTGQPGSSFALEIAREIGFPGDVLERAGTLTGVSQLDFDRELQNLEVEKDEVTRKHTELNVADSFLAELIGKYEKMTADLESKKKEILEKAREEAKQLLRDSNSMIERTIREIREAQAEKERTKEVRSELVEFRDKIFNEKNVQPALQGTTGASAVIREKQPEKSSLPEKKTVGAVGSEAPHRFQKYFSDLHEKMTHFSLTLDLRGKRADEALSMLQRYIDDAILLSISEVQILHGKGNGVLRQITRDYLRSQKEVKSARDAPLEQGGAGITVVLFR